MKVHLYTMCWNEADILDFFFRHYDPFVERYVIYDDGSTDGSIEKFKAHPKVELRKFTRSVKGSFVFSQQALQNTFWRESRGEADWVIVTAIDEHLALPQRGDMHAYLEMCKRKGVTAIPGIGFQMLSDSFPDPSEHLASTRTVGAPWRLMNKLAIFDPNKVTTPGFYTGRHGAFPKGKIVFPDKDQLMILHYKYLEFERTLRRQQALSKQIGLVDRASNWGGHYQRSRETFSAEWQSFAGRAIDIGAAEFDPAAPGNFEAPIWWRGLPRYYRLFRRLVRWFALKLTGNALVKQ